MRYGDYDDIANRFTSTISSLPNPLLRWEKTTSYNLGFETSLFDNVAYFSAEYYCRKDQLINKKVS